MTATTNHRRGLKETRSGRKLSAQLGLLMMMECKLEITLGYLLTEG